MIDFIKDADCTKETPVRLGVPDAPIYGKGIKLKPRVDGRTDSEHFKKIYLPELLPLEEYDLIVVLISGGKDSVACYLKLLELGVPKERIEFWHHDIDGGHPSRRMDWKCTQNYVKALADAEGIKLRVSYRVNGFFGELYRIGASEPIEWIDPDTGEVRQCKLSSNYLKCKELKEQATEEMEELLKQYGYRMKFPAKTGDLSRRWCSAYLKICVADTVVSNLDRLGELEELGGKRHKFPAKGGTHSGRWCSGNLKAAVQDSVTANLEETKHDKKILIVSGERRGESAGRLVMTEEAFFSSAAQKDCFDELDVEQFEIVATLDSHTSDICRGMDGKHFPMSEWKVGVTAPPFHVHCRSTTVPYFDDEFDAVGERAARDEETGKTYFVPGNMTYKEWEKSFVNGDKSGLQAVNSDDTIKEKEPSEAFQQIQKACEADKVEHRPVQKLSQPLSSDEIIERLAGGDMTKGSCSSLAFAYIGNRNGLDVLDFRGGSSQYVFSMNSNIKKILELPGVNGSITMVKKEISGTMEVLNNLVLNKEYYLATGKHAAIVRRVDSGVEYLELQSKFQNGWMPFDRYGSMAATLNKRFGCRKTVDKQFGKVWEKSVVLMDVESFNENAEFEQILGYINTAVESQKKGVTGDVK